MSRAHTERGSAAAEIAVALPALVLVLAASLAGLVLGIDQVRCVDAAHTAARLLARGDDDSAARAGALAAAPDGARVVVEAGTDAVTVTVSAPLPGRLLGWSGLPGPQAVAAAVVEGAP